jgi:hypothetical protein
VKWRIREQATATKTITTGLGLERDFADILRLREEEKKKKKKKKKERSFMSCTSWALWLPI